MKKIPYKNERLVSVNELVGLTFDTVKRTGDLVTFRSDNGRVFKMYHSQSCCEYVGLEEVIGDLNDLEDTPILLAEEREGGSDLPNPEGIGWNESQAWTFYEFRTIKGSVTLRWFGSSNGYYSTEVSLFEVTWT